MYAGERFHTAEPQAEELVGPALCLQDVESQEGVVVDGVNDHLHEVDLVRLDRDFLSAQNVHSDSDEAVNAIVDMATEAEHHGFGELAGANAVNTSNPVLHEHVRHHREQSLDVFWLVDKLRGTELHKVVQGREHVLEVQLSTGLKGGMDKLKCLPHDGGDPLSRERAAIDDLEHFVVQICHMLAPLHTPTAHQTYRKACSAG